MCMQKIDLNSFKTDSFKWDSLVFQNDSLATNWTTKLHSLTSCAGMTCHDIENILSQNCNIFSVLSIFKYNLKGKTNKFITS